MAADDAVRIGDEFVSVGLPVAFQSDERVIAGDCGRGFVTVNVPTRTWSLGWTDRINHKVRWYGGSGWRRRIVADAAAALDASAGGAK